MNTTRVKISLSAACLDGISYSTSLKPSHQPVLGDVAIFEVIELGKHTRIQVTNGQNRAIYPGDYLLSAFGPRYATGQFEGEIPFGPQEYYHMLGQGGAIGWVKSSHAKYRDIGPTVLRLVGFAIDEAGEVINAKYFGRESHPVPSIGTRPHTILSVGSSMDSGKTTTAAFLAKGLRAAGRKIGYIKLTGTIYSKDANLVEDTGADLSLDFSHFGYPSTYLVDPEELVILFHHLLAEINKIHPDDVIIEIADGLLQGETRALLQQQEFMAMIDHVVFSSGDSLGVLGGLSLMKTWGIEPRGISGLLTASPLLIREVEQETQIPVWTLEDLSSPAINQAFSEERCESYYPFLPFGLASEEVKKIAS